MISAEKVADLRRFNTKGNKIRKGSLIEVSESILPLLQCVLT